VPLRCQRVRNCYHLWPSMQRLPNGEFILTGVLRLVG
jgi:hypothetical protein